MVEAALTVAMLSLLFWFAPAGRTPMFECSRAGTRLSHARHPMAYSVAVLFMEPFYVAAGLRRI